MVMRSALGAKGTPYEVDIERGKVGEFARAIGSRHPSFLLRDKAVSPPTFLATIFFWEDRVQGANPWSQVEMSQERGMHAEQAYELVGGPPRAGERLVATSEIDGIWDKESRSAGTLTFVRMTTTFVNEAGEVRAAGDNHFVTRVLDLPKIFLLGDEDDLRTGKPPESSEN